MGRSALIAFICAGTAGAQVLQGPQQHLLFCSQAASSSAPVPLMQCRQPEYTEEARIVHLSGTVTLSLTVDDEGIPTDIHVVSPLGLGLDEKAVSCVHQSRYSPAQKDGKSVPSKIDVAVPFQQHWDSDWHVSAAVFRTTDGCARPTVTKAKFPGATNDHRSLTVCVHLTIGKDGAPRDLQIATPQDARLDKEALAIVSGLQFRPGTRNHQPVDVPATFTLVHGIATRTMASRKKLR